MRKQRKSISVTTFITDLDDTFKVECPGASAKQSGQRDTIRVRGPEACFFDDAPQTWGVFAFSRSGDAKDEVTNFSVDH